MTLVQLPPSAELEEILNKAFDGPMMFKEGIYLRVPVKDSSKIIELFDI